MAAKGPIPKRSEVRRRTNEPTGGPVTKITNLPAPRLTWPGADPHWDPRVTDLYESIQESGMVALYQQSDVQMAVIFLSVLDQSLTHVVPQTGMMSVTLFEAAVAGLATLGITEGQRRRLNIEIAAPEPPNNLVAMAEYKAMAEKARANQEEQTS